MQLATLWHPTSQLMSMFERHVSVVTIAALVASYILHIYVERERNHPLSSHVHGNVPTSCGLGAPCQGLACQKCLTLIDSLTSGENKFDCALPHVFIFSHRRSGTHMTINLIRFGFHSVQVWKMNHASCGNCTLVASLRQCGALVHAIRNSLDVAVSVYEYVQRFDAKVRNLTLNEFISSSKIARRWASYTHNCKYVPSMIEIDFELTRNAPETAHRLISKRLGWLGQWNTTFVPRTGAVSFRGGRLGGWSGLNETNLREYLNHSMSERWEEPCSCDKSGHANDGHLCKASITLYSQ